MAKQYASATMSNRQPILEVLKKVISPEGNILEIASGTGEHAHFFAPYFASQTWIPSDKQQESLSSITDWRKDCVSDNLALPLSIDVMSENWHQPLLSKKIMTIICINMIHIAPWSACVGLMKGGKDILPTGGIMYLYGAYKFNNEHISDSNQEFDRYLQMQNRAWGVRNFEDVIAIAQENKFSLQAKIAMPVNNFSLIFEKN
jgi:Protein of unknown function (DUF938)